jgi:PTS system nitrogen regulatory IIA component
LLALLKREGKLANVDAARQAVWQREKSMSTGLQYGVAIPHGKTDTVDGLVCAVGIQPEGVDFESMDGSPSRIFILTLSPASKPAPHVQFMSTVSQVLNETGRQRILECTSAGGIYRAFTAPAPSAAPAVSSPPPAPSTHRGQFNISDYLQPELVTPRLSGATGEAIIRELVDLLAGQGLVRDADAAARAVLDREATMSTGMESGVAVPHGRTDAVDRLVCAVGVRREGVDFGAADGKPSRIFVLVITPEAGADPYLQFVAALMGVLDEDGRQAVLAATTREQLYTALTHRAP